MAAMSAGSGQERGLADADPVDASPEPAVEATGAAEAPDARDGEAAAEADQVGAAAAEPANGEAKDPASLTDLDFLRALIAAVDESGIDSLELVRAGTRIRISKSPNAGRAGAAALPPWPAAYGVPMAPPALPVPGQAAGPSYAGQPVPPAAPAEEAAAAEAGPPEPETHLIEVRSPMVGTFYRAPAPEAPPYVEPGSRVSKGQTLCILEAMKLMNELNSEVDGVVREILVENAEPVEYGQLLFRVEPTGG